MEMNGILKSLFVTHLSHSPLNLVCGSEKRQCSPKSRIPNICNRVHLSLSRQRLFSACTIATMYIRPLQKSVLDLVFTHSKKYSRPAFKGPVASYNESTTQMNSRKRNEQGISNHLVLCQIIKHMWKYIRLHIYTILGIQMFQHHPPIQLVSYTNH